MNRYMLTNEGRVRFKRLKLSVNAEITSMEGYEALDYLYEHGAGTVEEIADFTGLSQGQVIDKLLMFMNHGFLEKLPS